VVGETGGLDIVGKSMVVVSPGLGDCVEESEGSCVSAGAFVENTSKLVVVGEGFLKVRESGELGLPEGVGEEVVPTDSNTVNEVLAIQDGLGEEIDDDRVLLIGGKGPEGVVGELCKVGLGWRSREDIGETQRTHGGWQGEER